MRNSSRYDASIIQAIRNRGYKATPQRIAICKIALGNREHPSMQKIHLEVKKTHPTVSLATVYKTLHILKEIGLIQELNFPEKQTRFDTNLEPHINLVCLRCGSIQDLDDLSAKELIEHVTAKTKFNPTAQRIDIYGICEHCSNIAKFK